MPKAIKKLDELIQHVIYQRDQAAAEGFTVYFNPNLLLRDLNEIKQLVETESAEKTG